MDIFNEIWKWLFIDQPNWVSNVSNLTSFTILGTIAGLMVGFYRRFNCNYPRCPRIALHEVRGTTYRTCRKHLTISDHNQLKKTHAKKFPEQHELLNQNRKSSK